MARKPIILPHGEALRGAQSAAALDLSNFIPLCKKMAWRYQHTIGSYDDAVQIAAIGLLKGRNAWEPTRGPFAIVAGLYINSELRTAADAAQRDRGTPVQDRIIGKHQVRRGARLPEERIEIVSANAPVVADGSIELVDLVADTQTPTPEAHVIEAGENAETLARSRTALACLNPRERRIVEAHILADEPLTLREIGTELGVSTERVRQIETFALMRMRSALNPSGPPMPSKAEGSTAADLTRTMLADGAPQSAIFNALVAAFPQRPVHSIRSTLHSQTYRWRLAHPESRPPRGVKEGVTPVVERTVIGPRDVGTLNSSRHPAALKQESIPMTKKSKKSAPAKKSAKATGPKGPGVIASIIEIIGSAKGATAEEIIAILTKRFPDRDPKSMLGTVRIQAPKNSARKEQVEGRGLVYFGKAR
ncbi:MAG TPA: sigma-70 family RNA polymerase sigma factor [Bauldia sp.]|nr:sigma-70 family RNA polymerase sigma factor [Bauldia sp.]